MSPARRGGLAVLLLLGGCGARTGIRGGTSNDSGRRLEDAATFDAPLIDAPASDGIGVVDAGTESTPDAPLVEVCNGIDDDRNEIVDDGYRWLADPDREPIRVSSEATTFAEPSGVASDGASYLAFYEGEGPTSLDVFVRRIDRGGSLGTERILSGLVAPAHGGTVHGRAISWLEDRYGAAWIDLRNGTGGAIYFAALAPDGEKIGAGDVRVSGNSGLGFNPSLHAANGRFLLSWSDAPRIASLNPTTRIYVRAIDPWGQPTGGSVEVTNRINGNHDSPFVAATDGRAAVAWIASDGDAVRFLLFDADLAPVHDPITLTPPGSKGDFVRAAPLSVGWVVTWHGTTAGERTTWAAVIDDSGATTVGATPIVVTGGHARYPFPIGLGNRFLLVYSDDSGPDQGYDVVVATFDSELALVDAPQSVTRAAGDSIFPSAVFGPEGEIGIVLRDDRGGDARVYFTWLDCTR